MKKIKLQFWIGLSTVLLLNLPLYWVLNISLMPETALRSFPPKFFPSSPQWSTYKIIIQDTGILQWLGVSLLIASLVVLVSLAVGILGAYSLSRYKYRSTRMMGFVILISQMLPSTLLVIPLFIMLKSMHITSSPMGNLLAVLISHCAIVLPFIVWMLKGYFDTIPIEIEQSAQIDGCSNLRTLWTILMPLARPGVAAAALYGFVLSWNDFIFSKSFLAATKPLWTVSLGIAGFRGEFITPWNQVMGASLLSALPIILLVLVLQKHFVSGLTGGSIK